MDQEGEQRTVVAVENALGSASIGFREDSNEFGQDFIESRQRDYAPAAAVILACVQY